MKKILLIIFIVVACGGFYLYDRTPHVSYWQVKYYHNKALSETDDNKRKEYYHTSWVILAKAIKKHPNYLEPRILSFNLAIDEKLGDVLATEIRDFLRQAHENKNQWDDGAITEQEMLFNLQEYQHFLFTSLEQDEAVEKIANEILLYYPNHYQSLNVLGTINIFYSDFAKAREYFLRAEKISPNDDIIKNNLEQLKFLEDNGFFSYFGAMNDVVFYANDDGIFGVVGKDILFEAYLFDNGPDPIKDGLMRIIDENDLIGFADENGKIIIKPQYKFARQENGKIKAANKGTYETEGEYTIFKSDDWFYIDNPLVK